MKTRERRLIVPSEERLRPFRRVGTPTTPTGELLIRTGSHELLREVITPNSENVGGRSKWKSFSHYKRWDNDDSKACHNHSVRYYHADVDQYILITGSEPKDVQALSGFEEYGDGPLGGLPSFFDESQFLAEGEDIIPPPSNLDDLTRMALKTMSPKIRAQLSLLNTLLEFKDFRKLSGSLSEVRKLASQIRGLGRGSPSKTLAQLLRVTADSYLQVMFNFRPLLSDIAGIHRAMTTVLKRFDAQTQWEGRPQIAHFGYVWNEAPPTLTQPELLFGDSTGRSRMIIPKDWSTSQNVDQAWVTRKVVTSATIFHAQMQYVVRHPVSLPTELARGLALLDGLGVNLNPAIIWNAIPWSFVVDWFVRVGEYLDGFKVGFTDPQIDVLQYLWSVKRERVIQYHVRYPTWVDVDGVVPFAPNGQEYSLLRTTNETAYRRSVGIPERSLFSTSGLSLTELSLGVALGVSKVLGQKRSARRKPTDWVRVLKRNLRRMRIRRVRKR